MPWRLAEPSEESLIDSMAGDDPRSGFMQSAWWAGFKRSEGYEVLRLLYELEGKTLGCTSLMNYPVSGEAGFVLCPEGPVLRWENVEESRQALRELIEFTRQMPNVLGLRIEPHHEPPLPTVLRNWVKAPTDLTPEDTLILDLELSEEELLTQARPKCRYNLKVAERHGVTVESEMSLDIAGDFYRLMLETSARDGFFIEPFGFFLNLMTVAFAAGVGEVMVARHDGRMLAAILVIHFGRRSTYLYGASSSENRKVMPTYPLHLAAIRSAKARGSLEYDFYGIDAFERQEHLYAGITRFKKQWGGTVQRRIGARDHLFYDRLAELMVESANAQGAHKK